MPNENFLPPNIGAVVQYCPEGADGHADLHLVRAWLKPRSPLTPIVSGNMALCGTLLRTNCAEQAFDAFLRNLLPPNTPRSTPLVWCRREEATHLSLYSATQITAPVHACIVMGVVDWNEDWLAKKIEAALRLAGKPSGLFA